MSRKGPRIWPDSEFLRTNADLLDDFFRGRGAFAELVRLRRWNDRRRERWQTDFVEKLRKYAAWLEQEETRQKSGQSRGGLNHVSPAQRRRMVREVQLIEELRQSNDWTLTAAAAHYLKTKAPKERKILSTDDKATRNRKIDRCLERFRENKKLLGHA